MTPKLTNAAREDRVFAAQASDPSIAQALAQTYVGTTGNDDFTGTSDADTADLSQGGSDIFRGLGGDDGLYLGAALDATDRLNGGAGSDYMDLEGDYSAGVTFRATTIQGIEDIYLYPGHSYNLTLHDGNVKTGDRLLVFAAQFGVSDRAIIDGSAETSGDLLLYGGPGDDILTGGGGNDLLRPVSGTDIIDGGAGLDRVSFFTVTSGVTIDLTIEGVAQNSGVGMVTLSRIENLSGSKFADTLTGTSAANQIIANGGDDVVNGAGGDDWLIVGPDLDGLTATAATISGGSGIDLVDFLNIGYATAGVDVNLRSRAAQDTGQGVYTVSGIEDAAGTTFADSITGSAVANRLYGNAGDDVLSGAAGDDILSGDSFINIDRESGTNSEPVEYDADTPGGDTLIGGAGADILTGGLGEDVFRFTAIGDSTAAASDRITDFAAGDILDVRRIDADAASGGNQAFHLGQTPGRTGDIVVSFDTTSGQTTLAFHVDGDASVDMTILLDGDHTGLTPADFLL